MKTKNEKMIESTGTGTGLLNDTQSPLVWPGRGAIWSRHYDGAAYQVRGFETSGARIVSAACPLSDEQAAAVARLVVQTVTVADFRAAMAAAVGDNSGDMRRADAAAAMAEVAHVLRFAESLGVLVDLGGMGAGAGHAVASRPMAERGAPCETSRRSARYESICDAFKVSHGTGTARASRRRWWRKVAFALPSSGGALLSLQSSIVGLPLRARRLDELCHAFGVARPYGLTRPAELVLAAACGKAERCGKRWVRGGSAKTAASKAEIGAGAAADDTAAHFVRLESEAVGIARGVWLDSIAPRVAALESAGVRINRRMRRALVGPVPVLRPLSRWLTSGRVTGAGVLTQGGKRARVSVLSVSPVMLGAAFGAGLSAEALLWLGLACVLARPVVVVGHSNPALSKAARAACESWEYAAVKARDGREVGGGWAIQGAIHGLRDFALSSPQGATSDESALDDFGAAEWSNQLDAAAARIDGARTQDRVSALVAEGYSERLAARLVADEQAAASAEQDKAAHDLGGVLRFAPDSGAGGGMPGWVADSVRESCDKARAAMAERLSKARNQDKGKIAESDGAALDLLESLERWLDGGAGLSDEQAALWMADFDEQALSWNAAAWQRFSRLRKRAGIIKRDGPLCGRVVSQSRGAVCLSAIGRKSAFRPSDEWPELSDEQAAAIAALVTV